MGDDDHLGDYVVDNNNNNVDKNADNKNNSDNKADKKKKKNDKNTDNENNSDKKVKCKINICFPSQNYKILFNLHIFFVKIMNRMDFMREVQQTLHSDILYRM